MDFPTDSQIILGLSARVFAVLLFFSAVVPAADPAPQPTPRPGTLGAYAEKITLRRSTLCDEDGHLVLTNKNVATLGDTAAITLGSVPTTERKGQRPSDREIAAERSRWRGAHQRQQDVIEALERRRARLEVEIKYLENQSLTIKTMARLQTAEARLQQLDREIAVERAELARIVREARRHGAEPGWFR
jgi:septal ring factor EnvC (AmiA/AmiB activator)